MFWRRQRSELDFADEIESHISHEADRLMSEGMAAEEARALARRTFGSVSGARRRYSDEGRGLWLDHVREDIRYAVRSLRNAPWFTAAGIISLALGIGFNTAVFTLIYAMVYRPLPLPDAERLITVHHDFQNFSRNINGSSDAVSYPEYRHYREQARLLDGIAAFANIGLTVGGAVPVPGSGLLVSCNYFQVLGAPIALGRSFTADECEAGGHAVVVLGHGFWQRQFGSDAGILGRTILLNRQSVRVVGVAAREFTGTDWRAQDVWLPVTMRLPLALGGDLLRGKMINARIGHESDPTAQPVLPFGQLGEAYEQWLQLIGRVKPGVAIPDAQAELNAIARRADGLYAGRATTVRACPASRSSSPSCQDESRLPSAVLLGLAGLIVVMACLNLMNLLLARAPARQRAVRIRLALGASRRRVLAHLLTESVLLALLGGAAGLAIGIRLPQFFLALLSGPAYQVDFSPDLRILGYALIVSLGAVAIFGLAPAFETTRVDLASAMRGDSAGSGRGKGLSRLRRGVVGAQVAGSLVLLVLASLFVRSILRVRTTDPGYVIKGIHAFKPALSQQGYDAARAASFYRDLRERIAALPAVESVALAMDLPLGGRSVAELVLDEAPTLGSAAPSHISYSWVDSSYFATLGIAILRGRGSPGDDGRRGGAVPTVISQSMAQRLWPGMDPLGKRFSAPAERQFVVVGVARDARNTSLAEAEPIYFYALSRFEGAAGRAPSAQLIVRTSNDAAVTAAVQRLAAQLDPNVLVTASTLKQVLARELEPLRMAALL